MKVATQELIDYIPLRESVLVLRAVNHKFRQKMLRLLDEHAEMTVTDIFVLLRVEQSLASQHLAILRKAGVVMTDRKGKNIFYSLNQRRLDEINKLTNALVGRKIFSL